ncbi:MAG TPA: penicillin-binding transpeptidase domain-containing protein [Jatrophihabitantaceae bacterium]
MRRLTALAVVPLLGGLLVACGGHSKDSPQKAVAQRFLDALGHGDAATAAAATSNEAAAGDLIASSLKGLGNPTGTLKVTSVHSTTADFSASWSLPGATAAWTYEGTLKLAQRGGSWSVDWAPSDLNPGLSAGQHLVARRALPPRAELEDATGKALFAQTPVVYVGIDPAKVTNLDSLASTLATTLHIRASDIVADVKAAKDTPHAFVPVITLRKPAYDAVYSIIHPLPGTVFDTGTELLGPTSRFAQPLLGHVGLATADSVKASSGRIHVGDQTGLDGLQQVFDAQLSGTPGVDVYAADADGKAGRKLGSPGAAKPGTPVRLTLDSGVQTAADDALHSVPQAAAIVALQPSTGRILAVANSEATRGDIALAGQYPPGSTFKIVTAAAALAQGGLTPDTQEKCPESAPAGGFPIHNNDGDSFPATLTLRKAFAMSCDTTFVQLALKLPPGALHTTASQFGLGAQWHLPVDSFSGSVPATPNEGELGQDSIGQGKVLLSPLAAAAMAGAAQSGRPIAPSLVVGKQANAGPALPATTTKALQEMMRSTITDPQGTATALAGLPGAPVSGKTGTAQYTPDNKQAHAWFTGYQGDLAFAVFVYGGQSSTKVSIPIAKTFLAGLP